MNKLQKESYGQTLKDVALRSKVITRTFSWGSHSLCVDRSEFSLHKFNIQAEAVLPLRKYNKAVTYYLRSGCVSFLLFEKNEVKRAVLRINDVIDLPGDTPHAIIGNENSEVFLFGPSTENLNHLDLPENSSDLKSIANDHMIITTQGRPTSDFREKYWGTIETIVDSDIAGKKISIRPGGQSSLEYHLHKTEAYYVSTGKVRVGMRIGRAENINIDLEQGDVFQVLPGTMHMRIGIEHCEIIEISTKDSDSDSRLVEDGKSYIHIIR